MDKEGTQAGVVISEVEEDKEDQMDSTHLTVLASLTTVIGVRGVWIVSMALDTRSGIAQHHSNVLFAMVHIMLGSVRNSRRRNTLICYIIVDTTTLRELAWQNLTQCHMIIHGHQAMRMEIQLGDGVYKELMNKGELREMQSLLQVQKHLIHIAV